MGKSTLGIDVPRRRSHGMAAVFSLEMSKTEITMRVLGRGLASAQDLRKGTLGRGLAKLARVMGDISVAPLYIDPQHVAPESARRPPLSSATT